MSFVVTSLSTGAPVVGAQVIVEGRYHNDSRQVWKPIISGVTDSAGQFRYVHTKEIKASLRRIVVSYDGDVLTLNPAKPPPHFLDNHWYSSRRGWLSWLRQQPRQIREQPVRKAHIFTERPVYRPGEPVHIKGYVRLRQMGSLIYDPIYEEESHRSLRVEGPGDKTWTYPVPLTEIGSFYHKFDEEDLPTGNYRANLLDGSAKSLASVTFKMEYYRIPRFEVQLFGPDTVPMDRAFTLTMTADYYAGGRLVGQELTWQVTQLPHTFRAPDQYSDFLFSADQRFSDGTPFRGTGSTKQELTDENGSATLELNPALEPDGSPRRYVVGCDGARCR